MIDDIRAKKPYNYRRTKLLKAPAPHLRSNQFSLKSKGSYVPTRDEKDNLSAKHGLK